MGLAWSFCCYLWLGDWYGFSLLQEFTFSSCTHFFVYQLKRNEMLPLFFLRRLLIYLCEPGCLKDCMPGLKVLLDYVWPDDWVIGMTFYFCRTLPFVLHSLLRRLAKTGMLNTLGLFWLVHTLDTRGIDSGLFRQEFFCFPFHLCWNWFDWYGVLLLLGATIFVFALTLSQISWGEMLQLFFLRCADLFLCTCTFEGLPTRCWAGSDGLVWLIVLRDYFLPGETTVGLFFLYTWAHTCIGVLNSFGRAWLLKRTVLCLARESRWTTCIWMIGMTLLSRDSSHFVLCSLLCASAENGCYLSFVWRAWVSCWAYSFVCDCALEEVLKCVVTDPFLTNLIGQLGSSYSF